MRHFHAVAPDFPAEAPGADRRVFPVVFDEADVVQVGVEADRLERAEIQLLQVVRVGFQDDLVLVIVLQTVGVFAIAAIDRAARGLDVGGLPRLFAEGAQDRRRVQCACANFNIVRLQNDAALFGPVMMQGQDQVLERECFGRHVGHKLP